MQTLTTAAAIGCHPAPLPSARFLYEDADSGKFNAVFLPHTQTVVLDPRSEQGRLTVQLSTEIVHYCVRVKEDDEQININLDLVDISVS